MGAGNSLKAILGAGLAAAVVSSVVQVSLWLLAGEDAWALLQRDTRLTAALVLGRTVLPPPVTLDGAVLLAASAVHLLLSWLYAALLWPLRRRELGALLVSGSAFGVALYSLNLYGFTYVFPWFVAARGGITLAAHLAFGVTVMLAYRWWLRR